MTYKTKSTKRRERFNFPVKSISQVKTKDEARTMAIDFQNWASEQNLSYSEISNYQNYFEELGKKFKLTEEFKENAII